MIVALFQSMKYQLNIPEVDINTRFPSIGTLLVSFFNIYGNQLAIESCDITPFLPTDEINNHPFNIRRMDPSGLRIISPHHKDQIVQSYKKSIKLKRILSYAYLYSMGCCDCIDWSKGSYLLADEQIDKLLDEERRQAGYIRYILPKLFNIQEAHFLA